MVPINGISGKGKDTNVRDRLILLPSTKCYQKIKQCLKPKEKLNSEGNKQGSGPNRCYTSSVIQKDTSPSARTPHHHPDPHSLGSPVGNEELEKLGFKIVIYANATMKAALKGMKDLLLHLREDGTTRDDEGRYMIPSSERHRLTNKDFYKELQKRYQ